MICNSYKAFKIAATDLIKSLLRRNHSISNIVKGWRAHMMRNFESTAESRGKLNQWFRRMLHWAQCSHQRNDQRRESAHAQFTAPSSIPALTSAQRRQQLQLSTNNSETPSQQRRQTRWESPPTLSVPSVPNQLCRSESQRQVPVPIVPPSTPVTPESTLVRRTRWGPPIPFLQPLSPCTTSRNEQCTPSTPVQATINTTPLTIQRTVSFNTTTNSRTSAAPLLSPAPFPVPTESAASRRSRTRAKARNRIQSASPATSEASNHTNVEYTEDLVVRSLANPAHAAHHKLCRQILIDANKRLPWENNLPCTTCFLRYKSPQALETHRIHRAEFCARVVQLRANINAPTSTAEHFNIQPPVSQQPNQTENNTFLHATSCTGANLLRYWCNQHYVCTGCTTTNHGAHTVMLVCPQCESPQPVDRDRPMFTVPRRNNDCGIMTVNAIINYFPISAASSIRRSFVTHLDMIPLVKQTGDRARVGMAYDYQHIQLALATRDYTCVPVFTDIGNDQTRVQLHNNFIAILVVANGHMYCYIKQHNTWLIFDSTYGTLQTPTYSTTQLAALLSNTNTWQNIIVGIINTQSCFRTHVRQACIYSVIRVV